MDSSNTTNMLWAVVFFNNFIGYIPAVIVGIYTIQQVYQGPKPSIQQKLDKGFDRINMLAIYCRTGNLRNHKYISHAKRIIQYTHRRAKR